jgi:hypothetical protein
MRSILRHPVVIDLAKRLFGDGQPLAVRADLGHEVFGVLFVG